MLSAFLISALVCTASYRLCSPSSSLASSSALATMPPKKQRSKAAIELGQEAYQALLAGAGSDDELFGEACLAMCDCGDGKVVNALGFPGTGSADMEAAATILTGMRQTFSTTLATHGSRTEAGRQQAQSIAAAVYSPHVSQSRAQLISGIPRGTWESGAKLKAANAAAGKGKEKSTLGISRHGDHVQWRRVHEWWVPTLLASAAATTSHM